MSPRIQSPTPRWSVMSATQVTDGTWPLASPPYSSAACPVPARAVGPKLIKPSCIGTAHALSRYRRRCLYCT